MEENEHSSVEENERNSSNREWNKAEIGYCRDETALSDDLPNSAEKIQMTSRKVNATIPISFQKAVEF